MLFDASKLSVEENRRQCVEVVAEARRYGAAVEGEIEGIQGVEDGVGSDAASTIQSLDVALDFIRTTGIDCFAPAIGNAHGMYRTTPTLDNQRVTDLVAAAGIPMALHGGTGMKPEQFSDLIARGCAKVNISTALKIRFMQSGYDYMTAHPGEYDPPALFRTQRAAVMDMAKDHIRDVRQRRQGLVTTLIFDCDGVLADTERFGHLPAFNRTFKEFGLPVTWSAEEYGQLVKISGGKERMATLLTPDFVAAAGLPSGARRPGGRGRALARAQDGDLHVDGRCRPASAATRHRADRRCGAGRRLDPGRVLDVGRGLRAGHPGQRGRPRRAARFALVLAGDVVATQEARTGHLPARARAAGRRREAPRS